MAYGGDVAGTDPESEQYVGVGGEVSLDVAVLKEALKTNALLSPVLTFERPSLDEAAAGYVRSFLVQRLFIGALGVALPFLLVGFGFWVDGHPVPRNSLSVYYYSGVGALFVGVLTTVAFFLIAYRLVDLNLENVLSIIAGLAVLVVVLFPTKRPEKAIEPTPLQDLRGESFVNWIHVGAAVVFIVLIGLISLFFGAREHDRRRTEPGSGRFWWGHLVCTGVIWLGGLWILATEVLGGPRWSVFAGEFVSFFAFGVSWLTKGAEFDALFGRKPSRPSLAP
jgi:hypothetical protein